MGAIADALGLVGDGCHDRRADRQRAARPAHGPAARQLRPRPRRGRRRGRRDPRRHARTCMCWRRVASHCGSPANASSPCSRSPCGSRVPGRATRPNCSCNAPRRAARRSTRRRTALPSTSCAGDSTGSHWRSSWRRRRLAPSIRLDSSTCWTTGSSCSVPITARAMPGTRRLRATFDWSYELLDEGDRMVFDRLGVIAGPFDIDDAVALCADVVTEFDVITSLASLVDKSLVQRLASSPPFRLLESLREFSLEQLVAAGADQSVHRRHAERFRDLAATLRRTCLGPREPCDLRAHHRPGQRLRGRDTMGGGQRRARLGAVDRRRSQHDRVSARVAAGRRRGSLTCSVPRPTRFPTRGPTSSPRRRRRHSTSSERWAGRASSPVRPCPPIRTTPRR